jgi:DNA polymerase III subunit alpha
MTRHASVHAAGVVIAPRPLTEFIPLYKSQKDEIVTQWAMKEVERVGLLKMDFLGLSTLTLIQRRPRRDQARPRVSTSTSTPSRSTTPKTFQLFSDGQTYGVFQFESSGMRDCCARPSPSASTT